MSGPHDIVTALATVLGTAAVTNVIFRHLRLPLVLGYIVAGVIIGPHVVFTIIADREIVATLSELGVILLMFSLGLEFSLRSLLAVGPACGTTALIQTSAMAWLGYFTGHLLGWTNTECLFAGAMISISSTTILVKVFNEIPVPRALREFVAGILIVEDLIAILLIAILTAIAGGATMAPAEIVSMSARLAAFLFGFVIVGLLVVPRLVRHVVDLRHAETTLVAGVGLCFSAALLAIGAGYSGALGAFMAGSLVAESGRGKRMEHLVKPVSDLFGAVFFVSVGMALDPASMAEHWLDIVIFTLVVVAGKFVGVATGAFLTGHSPRTAVNAGMTLGQIGEFSYIIATVGLNLKVVNEYVYTVAIAVSAITIILTPLATRAADRVALSVDAALPRRIQMFSVLYGSWIERMRTGRGRPSGALLARRFGIYLMIDAILLAALLAGAAVWYGELLEIAVNVTGATRITGGVFIVAFIAVLASPLIFGILRVSRKLGEALAEATFPRQPAGAGPGRGGGLDRAAAPRRALIVTLQLGILAIIGMPVAAVVQPFLPDYPVAVPVLALLCIIGVAFWRSTTDLQGHVHAGAHAMMESLALDPDTDPGADPPLDDLHKLLPGMGDPEPVVIPKGSPAVGRSIRQLQIRGLTGAVVLGIQRGNAGIRIPGPDEIVEEGDVLAVAGSSQAIAASRALLLGPSGERVTDTGAAV